MSAQSKGIVGALIVLLGLAYVLRPVTASVLKKPVTQKCVTPDPLVIRSNECPKPHHLKLVEPRRRLILDPGDYVIDGKALHVAKRKTLILRKADVWIVPR